MGTGGEFCGELGKWMASRVLPVTCVGLYSLQVYSGKDSDGVPLCALTR